MGTKHVDGIDKGKVMLYALSTCVWCNRTKRLLGDLDVAYDYIDVDMLSSADKEAALKEIEKYNPARSFPTLVVGDETIRGFKEDLVRKALG